MTISPWTPETQRYQDEEAARQKNLTRKAKHAQRMVDQKVDEIKRAVTSIKLWQRRVAYYEREKGVTLEAKRLQRLDAQRKRAAKRRKIIL